MDKKKLSAALAAVFAYIKTSEEAAAFYGQQVSETIPEQPLQIMQQNNIWGISGRGIHMQANTMMQMRMFK
ncbi:MAG: hypothetical protein H8D87_20455 [Deltaproteobacteria bacterium]|uniref:hypothetical protein n=1 Tax=Desulfobacula sp. TaxID=2593537 RepID=UPI0019CCC104|nr:hypothetical protein [Candidatus Desulfobacula maris]MBL6992329.1 hypothetical protein [Desulfobacula sp.]